MKAAEACYGVGLVTLPRPAAEEHLGHGPPGLPAHSTWCLPVSGLEMALGSKDAFCVYPSILWLSLYWTPGQRGRFW